MVHEQAGTLYLVLKQIVITRPLDFHIRDRGQKKTAVILKNEIISLKRFFN